MQCQFSLPNYKPILAVFVEQRLSQRMSLSSIDHNEPQNFVGEIYFEQNWSEIKLVMNQQTENCLLQFTYSDHKILSVLEIIEKEITEIWKLHCADRTSMDKG